MQRCPWCAQHLASELSRSALWEVYQETVNAPAGLTAEGDRQRTLGGQFIKLAKKRIAEDKIRWVGVGLPACPSVPVHQPASLPASGWPGLAWPEGLSRCHQPSSCPARGLID